MRGFVSGQADSSAIPTITVTRHLSVSKLDLAPLHCGVGVGLTQRPVLIPINLTASPRPAPPPCPALWLPPSLSLTLRPDPSVPCDTALHCRRVYVKMWSFESKKRFFLREKVKEWQNCTACFFLNLSCDRLYCIYFVI